MKKFWLSLSLREKQWVAVGSLILILFTLYQLSWAPFVNKVKNLRESVQHKQVLLAWMQEANQRIHQLTRSNVSEIKTSVSLLNLVQTEIDKTSLAKNVSQLQQADTDYVQLSFQKVSFDKLIEWMFAMTKEHQLIIAETSLIPSEMPGVVDANLKLKAA
jgi:type II secretory pathway component PulM